MTETVRYFQQNRRTPRSTRAAVLLALSLIAIRLVAEFFCATCFVTLEKPTTRSFYLHAGGDHDPCHHGKAAAHPLIDWACAVTFDDSAFVLPEVPRLPVVVSAFVPLALLVISYSILSLIAARGRSPPRCIA